MTLPAGTVELPAGAVVPVADGIDAQTGEEWARPVDASGDSSPVFVYSLLLATFLGTMGLPHILVRFYTNPDGPAARRTTVRVLGLLAMFYAFPVVYGALGRVLVPELYLTGDTDSVVLALPEAAWPGLGGRDPRRAGGGRRVRGVHVDGVGPDGVGGRDDLVRHLAARPRRHGGAAPALPDRRAGGVLAPVALALVARGLDISVLVGWAFALAASTFCPLLLLGIWWERLTARGAGMGLIAGATIATGLIFAGLISEGGHPTVEALLTQPAVISVPIAFAVMVLVSLADPAGRRAPDAELLALHAPEDLRLEAPARA